MESVDLFGNGQLRQAKPQFLAAGRGRYRWDHQVFGYSGHREKTMVCSHQEIPATEVKDSKVPNKD